MPLPRNFLRTEMLKFGVYIMFPIAALYVYNRPDIQEMLGSDHLQTVESFKIREDQLMKVPKTLSEIREEKAKLRQQRLEAQQGLEASST
ncbi:hypothetical protein BC832DRAFT_92425 [Gaertneriomyces semiglobifer]|nr:hypothetical protein BC832DRAFT_92425 [Gaertneriomyces semiglobifer]